MDIADLSTIIMAFIIPLAEDVIKKKYVIFAITCAHLFRRLRIAVPLSLHAAQKMLNGSSSGALFKLIADYVIDKGGIAFGAALGSDFNVVHRFARTKEELKSLLGSKYVQSDTATSYKQVRELIRKGVLVLYSGTPCQIVGLKSFLGKKLSQSDNLICADIICHGVTSPGVWQEYIAEQKYKEPRIGKLQDLTFRYKDKDCKNTEYSFRFRFRFRFRFCFRKASKDYFYQQFFKFYTLRPNCFHCDFRGLNRSWSDITLGDFPIPDKLVPDIYSPLGTSIVLLHSGKGQYLFGKIEKSLLWKEIGDEMIEPILKINPAIVESHSKPKYYQKFWETYEQKGYFASRRIAFTMVDKIKIIIPSFVKKPIKAVLHLVRK